jgi:hypothetical protein
MFITPNTNRFENGSYWHFNQNLENAMPAQG